ncbi:YqaJ viral recombinase family protein [Streptomyces showdoensis]|uniref:YqaJ viral recombinase family nuclease n=1 Tax=Streptomyces showdoensis TaxID=68268 RepID=UPI000F508C99|nr:YqaJ viral recombinase family protein [Streptomyces showdoensis]
MTLTYPSGAQIVLGPDAPADEWHAVRATGIGGSDIVAICGLNEYTSPLEIWLKKRGETVPRRHDPVLSEAAEMGHELEPFVASRFTKRTGLPAIDNPGTLRLPSRPHMLVNLDRATVENDEMGVLEIKTRSSYALKDWIDETPGEVQVQVQWQLALTGWNFGYSAASIGGQRTIVHRIERDQQMIDNLIAIGDEFWGWVQTGTRPPLDGSHATGQLLDHLHANPVEQIVVADPAEVEKWLKIRATAKEQAEAADIAITEAENHLKAIAGDATDVHIRGELAYSWRPRRGSIHWKEAALAADPDIDAEQYRGEPTRVLNVHLENL